MDAKIYLDKMRNIQIALLEFVESIDEEEIAFQDIIILLKNHNIIDSKQEFKSFLHLIFKISQNHHHTQNFFGKIEKILQYLKNDIMQHFQNSEIYKIFEGNKRIILFLIEEKIILIDKYVFDKLKNLKYFPEFKLSEIDDEFDKQRQKAENNLLICELIRNDSIKEFIIFVNQRNISLSSKIQSSLFESNEFLNKRNPSLIEYSAFFGSIQIFDFLRFSDVIIDPSIWIYAIHSNNPEMIHLLERILITPDDYLECYKEAIKCHHNDIANYIETNYLNFNESDLFKNCSFFFQILQF